MGEHKVSNSSLHGAADAVDVVVILVVSRGNLIHNP
jgi:hypothetical protein